MKTMQLKGLLFFVLAYGVLASAGCGGGDSEEPAGDRKSVV